MKKFIPKLITGAIVLTALIAPSATLNVLAAGQTISGYIKPSIATSNKNMYSNFKITAMESAKYALTDTNGYFELSDIVPSSSGYTITISKSGYLTRTINVPSAQGNIVLGSVDSPVELLAGDVVQDGTINMSDAIKIASSFNAATNDAKYNEACDISGNGSINMEDVIILARSFGKTSDSYPAITPQIVAPTSTPIPSVEPGEEWKLNTGTINLGSTITYTGTGISVSGNTVNITSGGDHTVKGTLSNGMIVIDTTERVKLRLSGANITNSNGPAIYCKNADKFFITIEENTTNTLVDGRNYIDQSAKGTISSNDDIEIKGKGTLNITGNYKHAISGDDDIKIENGNIKVISAVSDGIHANDSIKIKGGTLNITASKDCIQTEKEELLIEDGDLTLSAGSQGLTSDTAVTISGGYVRIVKAEEGVEAPIITISGGVVNITATDDGLNATKGGGTMFGDDGSKIIISGGSVYLDSSIGDPLDSNGSALISGGTTVIHGPQSMPEVGADVNGQFTVRGGTFFVCGPSNLMAQYPTGPSSQYSIAAMFSNQPANSPLCIKDSTGKVLFITKPKRNYIYAVFSSPELRNGSTYTIFAGGNVSGGTEVNGVITGGTYNGGTQVATITVNTSPTTAVNWNDGGFPGGGGWPGGGWPGGGG